MIGRPIDKKEYKERTGELVEVEGVDENNTGEDDGDELSGDHT